MKAERRGEEEKVMIVVGVFMELDVKKTKTWLTAGSIVFEKGLSVSLLGLSDDRWRQRCSH